MEINIVYTSSLTVETDHNNDIEREMGFYNIAYDSMKRFIGHMSEQGQELFPKINYLPLMAKKVAHMEKVANRLKKQEAQQEQIIEHRKKNLQKRFLKETKKTESLQSIPDEDDRHTRRRPKHKEAVSDELDMDLPEEDQVPEEEKRKLKYQKGRFGKKNRPKDIHKRPKSRRFNKKK